MAGSLMGMAAWVGAPAGRGPQTQTKAERRVVTLLSFCSHLVVKELPGEIYIWLMSGYPVSSPPCIASPIVTAITCE